MSHEKRVAKAYYRELAIAFVVYSAMLLATTSWGRGLPEGTLRTIVLVSPMLGFVLMIWAIARHLRRIDEYMRQHLLETLALASALTLGLTFTYGFLETAGYPKLSMFTVWIVMGLSFAGVQLLRRLLRR